MRELKSKTLRGMKIE